MQGEIREKQKRPPNGWSFGHTAKFNITESFLAGSAAVPSDAISATVFVSFCHAAQPTEEWLYADVHLPRSQKHSVSFELPDIRDSSCESLNKKNGYFEGQESKQGAQFCWWGGHRYSVAEKSNFRSHWQKN